MVENTCLAILKWFYRRARVVLAPNQELVEMMRSLTGRPTFLMPRGVDTHLFSPSRRTRDGGPIRIGYVGRLTSEKNVRFLADIGAALLASGVSDFEFILIGQGGQEVWLREHVPHAIMPGVLRGEALTAAYADMDLFVFPSTTDTFGNVILEALASGVPAVVTAGGGPKYLIRNGETGFVAGSAEAFITSVRDLISNQDLRARMALAARNYALEQSWDTVFEGVFHAYEYCLSPAASAPRPSAILTNA
jgi:glycosyltransferase involved in cell wall biosynthesis